MKWSHDFYECVYFVSVNCGVALIAYSSQITIATKDFAVLQTLKHKPVKKKKLLVIRDVFLLVSIVFFSVCEFQLSTVNIQIDYQKMNYLIG